jgi:cytochrome oxidase Cu insertion factor (SCO1/SenC/PrrC family)
VSGSAQDLDRRQGRLLVVLALVFFAPLGVAFYLYYGPSGWRPAGRVNHGDLIDPPRRLPALALPLVTGGPVDNETGPATDADFFKGKWTLLYWGAGACSLRCRTDLYDTRQVRLALNRDMGRVQRVFLAEGACCDMDFLRAEHPDLITVRATAKASPLLALLPRGGSGIGAADRVYLIDPLGNLMMSYAPDSDPKGMLEVLKRLLGLSQVG